MSIIAATALLTNVKQNLLAEMQTILMTHKQLWNMVENGDFFSVRWHYSVWQVWLFWKWCQRAKISAHLSEISLWVGFRESIWPQMTIAPVLIHGGYWL